MSIKINHKYLNDSPYNGENEDLFFFDSSEIDMLINDILNGHPTCYLISGYRGSGKTSFIKKVENKVEATQKPLLKEVETKKKNTDFKILESPYKVFIHSNFAKYESETNLLRKLIRGLYYNIEKNSLVLKYIESYDKTQAKIKEQILPELKVY